MTKATHLRSGGAGPLSLTGLTLSDIDPSRDEKFSQNLHAFIKNGTQGRMLKYGRVFRGANDEMYFGYFTDSFTFIGARLNQVLTYGKKVETFCFAGLGELVEVNGFWESYKRIGRCAIDVEHDMHFLNARNRWAITGNRRSCNWCGDCVQVETHAESVKVVKHSQWVAAAA